jgi:hypothetical protein
VEVQNNIFALVDLKKKIIVEKKLKHITAKLFCINIIFIMKDTRLSI